MKLPLVQVDAFSDGPFTGNPAAVVPLEEPLDEALMQRIAEENNLSETAFTAPLPRETDGPPRWALRWFTPTTEVELCGHATLGAAAALRDLGALDGAEEVRFSTLSGELVARFVADGAVEIDLPAAGPGDAATSAELDAVERALDRTVEALYRDRYLMAVLSAEDEVAALRPPLDALLRAGAPIVATAPSSRPDTDFVSRFFGPTLGVPEDPVTGSAHCQLMPYWAGRLGRRELVARQISRRGGRLGCTLDGDRVLLAGGGHVYLRGTIETD
ncbi:MAG: PhzF family phenazine biosynthesis protein [Planctomycetota bacterium]